MFLIPISFVLPWPPATTSSPVPVVAWPAQNSSNEPIPGTGIGVNVLACMFHRRGGLVESQASHIRISPVCSSDACTGTIGSGITGPHSPTPARGSRFWTLIVTLAESAWLNELSMARAIRAWLPFGMVAVSST